MNISTRIKIDVVKTDTNNQEYFTSCSHYCDVTRVQRDQKEDQVQHYDY